jgi:hypothetical protein
MIHGCQGELQPGELHNVEGGHGEALLGCGIAGETPINRSSMVVASIFGRCLGLKTKRAAARMITSLMARARVTSGISG